ncbi:single-stranded DNA-binding protein [Streptomyces sp. NPDC050418]|uniref:single-stranded DNA-binding protein n=1 Tax=Streptomyces sp. NPDC050418 TaxID=3365612 RepID=UPI00378FC62F
MNETLVTIVGNVATEPLSRITAGGPMVRFRLASTSRLYDRSTQAWRDGHTNFLTVFAWRSLAENIASSVGVGDPVVVHGKLKVRQDNGTPGNQSLLGVDIEAVALGHDLSRGTAAFRRVSRANTSLVERPGGGGGAGAGQGGRGTEPQFERDPGGEVGGAQPGFLPDREPEPVF